MQRTTFHHLIKSLLVLLFLITFTPPARAEFKIVVSPPTTDIIAKPGEIIQKTIRITNNSQDKITLSAQISDFIVQDDYGTPVKVDVKASGRYLASPWITLDRDQFVLDAQETKEVIVIIELPRDALPGGHYAGVFFSPLNKTKPTTTGAEVVPEIGSLFAITVPGDLNWNAVITSFATDQSLHEYGPVNFTATIENHSDSHITTKPELTIKDMLGRTVSRQELGGANIFPFTARTFVGKWDIVWAFGQFTATLTAPYGNSFVATRSINFWVLPYRLLLVIIILIIVILTIMIVIRRYYIHQQDNRDKQIDSLKRKIIELENKK